MKQYIQTNEDGVIIAVLEVGDTEQLELFELPNGQVVEAVTTESLPEPNHARQSVFDPPLGNMDDLIGRTFNHDTHELGPKPVAPPPIDQQPLLL